MRVVPKLRMIICVAFQNSGGTFQNGAFTSEELRVVPKLEIVTGGAFQNFELRVVPKPLQTAYF